MIMDSLPQRDFSNEQDAIESYFHSSFSYGTIVDFLRNHHHIKISLRGLKRKLKTYGLSRKVNHSPLRDVYAAIVQEHNGSGKLLGYRLMTLHLKTKYRLRVTHDNVRRMLLFLDPTGVRNRKAHKLKRRTYTSKGPNDTWHVDGYDKLKSYGVAINACIDGFSRKLLWLNCAYSNNDPEIISGYYVGKVRKLEFCPKKLRTDCGTENGIMAAMQCTFVNSQTGHIYGTSPSNQRIESWWSYFRKTFSQWWIEFFEDMCQSGLLDTANHKHIECVRFCFNNVVQMQLNEVLHRWNSHYIRPSRGAHCPGGIPDKLFFLPCEHFENCKVDVGPEETENMRQFVKAPGKCQSALFEEYLEFICFSFNWKSPSTSEEALELYTNLIKTIR